MSELPAHLKSQATKLIEEFLASCSTGDVFDFVHGKATLAFAEQSTELNLLRGMTIEDAYEHLNKKVAAELNKVVAPPTLRKPTTPKPTTKAGKIDHALMLAFGRTYTPPPPPKKETKPRSSAKATAAPKVWQPDEVIRTLSEMPSSQAAADYMARLGLVVDDLKVLAELLNIRVTSSTRKPALIKKVIEHTIGGRLDHEALIRR